jgi:predicted acyltransferase
MKNIRLTSLDVFRGITVAFMLIVNNPGDWDHIYWPLDHAKWDGCTPTDLVFPFFIFIVGVAIPFAAQNNSKETNWKIIFRGIKLFSLGLFLSLFPKFNFDVVRIMGVLQRIALVYMACALLFKYTNYKIQSLLLVCSLVGYYILMRYVHVPGIGPGNLQPDSNLGAYLDRLILTEPHLWKSVGTWDPEGLLGTLPAIGTGLMGLLAGQWLLNKTKDETEKVIGLIYAGLIAITLGYVWNMTGFPINKALWTSSYVLWTGGLALGILAILYYVIDVKGYKSFTWPLQVFGMNAILVFFGSGLLPRILKLIQIKTETGKEIGSQYFLHKTYIAPIFSDPYRASLLGAIVNLTIWFIVLYILWKKRIFVKV